jgi:hypothetical protein
LTLGYKGGELAVRARHHLGEEAALKQRMARDATSIVDSLRDRTVKLNPACTASPLPIVTLSPLV